MYLSDIYTVAVNLAGLPAVSLPCGMDSRGLPIGILDDGDRFRRYFGRQAPFNCGRIPQSLGKGGKINGKTV